MCAVCVHRPRQKLLCDTDTEGCLHSTFLVWSFLQGVMAFLTTFGSAETVLNVWEDLGREALL